MLPTRRDVIQTAVGAGGLFGAGGASRAGAARPMSTISLPTPRAKALMEVFGLKYPIFEGPHGRPCAAGR